MTKRILSGIFAAALLLLAACDKTPQPPLVFGASAWPGYEPVYLARELGYFQGANLRLDAYQSPAEAEEAIRSRKAHLAALSLDRALLLHQDIPDLKIILIFDAQPAPEAEQGQKGESTKQAESTKQGESAPKSESAKRIDVLVTRDESIGQYHHEMQQFLQGWRRALDYLHGNPDKAMQIMAQREHVTPAQFNALLQGIELYGLQRNQQAMIGEPPPIGGAVETAQRALLSQGKLSVGVDPSMLLDSTLLAESPK